MMGDIGVVERTPSASVSHSYQGQDRFVVEALGGMRDGFFLDSGASNGRKGNNTWLLEQAYGWTGICVEPNAASFSQLLADRACICLNCCIYDRDGPVDFFEAAGVLGGITAEYDPAHLDYALSTLGLDAPAWGAPPTVRKQAYTLRSLLGRTGAPQVIDYWSLDTEGSELAILRSFPFDAYRFRTLTVEHNNLPVREEIHEFLAEHGYVRVQTLGIDDAYVCAAVLSAESVRWRAGREASSAALAR